MPDTNGKPCPTASAFIRRAIDDVSDRMNRTARLHLEMEARGARSPLCFTGTIGQVHLWVKDGKTFVTVINLEHDSWELYTPVSQSPRIDDTLAALDQYLSVDSGCTDPEQHYSGTCPTCGQGHQCNSRNTPTKDGEAWSFIGTISRMTQDGEDNGTDEPFEMSIDDAFDTVNNLIAEARKLMDARKSASAQSVEFAEEVADDLKRLINGQSISTFFDTKCLGDGRMELTDTGNGRVYDVIIRERQ